MIKLTIGQVLNMHRMMIRETGGTDGVRDMGMLDMALSGAFQTFDGKDLYPSIQDKATQLAFSIVKNHPFVDGNKRIGLFVMLVFLEINGIELIYTQQELIDLGIGLADGSIDTAMLLAWICEKSQNDNCSD
ncbi:type II toxin-antitoxin system death-on-curing family toxin [Ruminococcaceae bacterium OttesenSCG-928-L11]|nr:type II toxin-antitoxin system death-on-curing family toxin [Ruminococcaceae bacterium OttesenSCG-928-L11]